MKIKKIKTYITKQMKRIKKVGIKKFKFLKQKKNRSEISGEVQQTGFKLYEVIIILLIAASIGILSGAYLAYPHIVSKGTDKDTGVVNEDLKQFINVYESILDSYYETVDKDELVEAAIKAMINVLGDPYTSYFDSDEKKVFDERMKGEYYGIGVELVTDVEGNIIILNVFDDSPAKEAGLKSGDIIKGLDDKTADGLTSSDVAVYIKEGASPNVDVKVEREKKQLTISLTKRKITLDSINTDIFEENNKKIGYVNVSIFADNTYSQFRKAILEFEEEKIDSLIIDVRNNSGGYLNAVVNMISMYLPKDSTIYQTETNKDVIKHYDLTEEERSYPVVVLINNQSASASEILAAAFKEVYKSEIVGITSYGKGTVQETKNLANGGMIKITTQKWLTPLANSIEGNGIEPTIEVIMNKAYYTDPTYKNDNQLKKALDLLKK